MALLRRIFSLLSLGIRIESSLQLCNHNPLLDSGSHTWTVSLALPVHLAEASLTPGFSPQWSMANLLKNNLEPFIRGRYLDLARIKIQVHCHPDPIGFSAGAGSLSWMLGSPLQSLHMVITQFLPKGPASIYDMTRAPGLLPNSLNGPRLSQGWAPTPRLLGCRRRGCLFNINVPCYSDPLGNLEAWAQEYMDVQNLCEILPPDLW